MKEPTIPMEIRDLLKEILENLEKQTPEKRRKPKPRAKPQLKPKPKPEKPSDIKWAASEYPIEQWKLGKTKIYPIALEPKLHNRVWHVNARMKECGFSNHWRHRKVLRHGRIYVEIRRDR